MIGAGGRDATATIRHGVRAMAAINQTTVPWCTVIVRNAFGVAGAVHQPAGRLPLRYAWLSGDWGSLPLEGGIEAAYRAEIDAAADPKAKLAEIEERLNKLRSPFRTAETLLGRGDHRPARHAVAALRVRPPGRAGTPARRRLFFDQAVAYALSGSRTEWATIYRIVAVRLAHGVRCLFSFSHLSALPSR